MIVIARPNVDTGADNETLADVYYKVESTLPHAPVRGRECSEIHQPHISVCCHYPIMMGKLKTAAACLVLAVFSLQYQNGHSQEVRDRRQHQDHRKLAQLARATTKFGLLLYGHLKSEEPQSNLIFSPISVYTALCMTLLGAEGETEKELRSVLSLRPRQNVHRTLHAVFESFPNSAAANVTLKSANTIYYRNTTVTLADTFKQQLRQEYGASPRPFQFPDPETDINDWVSGATGGKIRDFLSRGAIKDDDILMLLNAVYFQGNWKEIFSEEETRKEDFTTGNGDVIQVQMMGREGAYSVKDLDDAMGARVLELPYGNDGRFSMFVILPNEVNGLSQIEQRLNPQVLDGAVTNMPRPSRYRIGLPRFCLRTKKSLKGVLTAMGLTRLFSNAELRPMLAASPPGRLVVSKVEHEAVIEVDEKGTRAAAVTSITITVYSEPPSFVVNRPFFLVLRDNSARLNLFMGRVNRPEPLKQP